jgi:hypothetical protein
MGDGVTVHRFRRASVDPEFRAIIPLSEPKRRLLRRSLI